MGIWVALVVATFRAFAPQKEDKERTDINEPLGGAVAAALQDEALSVAKVVPSGVTCT